MKTLRTIAKKRLLVAGVMASAVALIGTRAYAQVGDALNIETNVTEGSTGVTYNGAGDGGNQQAVITAILSQPGSYGGHTFTSWSFTAADASGSIEEFGTLNPTANAGITDTNPAVGQVISMTGTYRPFNCLPEFGPVTALSSATTATSPGPVLLTIPQILANPGNWGTPTTQNLAQAVAGYFSEIQNVSISGVAGGRYSLLLGADIARM